MSQTKAQLIDNLVQPITGALGSAAAPTFSFTADPNTGLFSPGADAVALATAGTNRFHITSGGLVGIGTTTPDQKLVVSGSLAATGAGSFGAGNIAGVYLSYESGGEARVFARSVGTASDLSFWTSTAGGSSERARIDSSGRLLVGTSSSRSTYNAGDAPKFQVESTTAGATVGITLSIDNTNSSELYLAKARGSAVNSHTIVQNNDNLGILFFGGADGTNIIRAASVGAQVDGTPGANDMPGRLVFSTTADGASSPTERMRIDNNGRILIGSTSQDFTGQANKISRSQGPSSTSTAWADQVTPLGVYGNFGNGGGSQQCSSALTVYGWSSNGTGGAIMRGWWSSVQASLSTPTLVYQVAASGNVTNTNNSYGSLSDVRYKQDIIEAGSQWNDIKNITIKKFRFIDSVQNETKENPAPYQLGCIAQEVVRVSPGLVEVRGDDKGETGDVIPNVLTIKYSVLYMKAVKALQEAMERIETLEAAVTALQQS
jgi:hypothetical protein